MTHIDIIRRTARSPASPEPSSWSAPARWAAPCWRAGWRSGSIRNPWSRSSRSRRAKLRRSRAAACGSIRRPHTVGEAAAIVIAVKPQVAPDGGADARALSRRRHGRALDHGRPHARLPRTGAVAARRAGARDAEHAGRDRPRHHRRGAEPAGVAAPARSRRMRCLSATGAVEWIGDEALMDAVTAVSGSGPGLCVPAGGGAGPRRRRRRPAGGSRRRARARDGGRLRRAAAPLAARCASVLRQNVTSPGGTTAAALDVLMAPDGLDPLMTRAVAAATRRSRELAG